MHGENKMSFELDELRDINKKLTAFENYLVNINSELIKMRADIKPWYIRLYDYVKTLINKGN